MDGKESNILKMDQKKRISISKIDKIFKVNRLYNISYLIDLHLTSCTISMYSKYYVICYYIVKSPRSGHPWGKVECSL